MNPPAHVLEVPDEVSRLRVPPHSVEAEQSVLGGLLIDNSAWDRAADLLVDGDFYRHEHQVIFGAVGGLINAGKPADVITVFEQLRGVGKDEQCGGLVYLNALAQSIPSAANLRRYAEIVRERAVLRQLVAASDEIATAAFNLQGRSVGQLLDDAQTKLMQVAEGGQRAGANDWEDMRTGVVTLIDHISALATGDIELDVVPTGITELDEKLDGGGRPGELVAVGARSGMGKTAMAVTALINAAKVGKPGAIVSLEMPKRQLHQRMLSFESHVHLTKFKRPERLNDFDWAAISKATETIANLPIHVSDRSGLNINQIRAMARALKRKHGLRALWVDHLTLVRGVDPKMLRAYQLQEVTSGLKALAKELGITVYLLVQIDRSTDARVDSMPQLADIKGTASVEEDSDVVVFIHREAKNKPDLSSEWKYFAELFVAKQRDGELGRLPAMYVGENTRFANWPADEPVPTTKVRSSTREI